MPHLVEPIKREQDNPLPIADALQYIQEAHDYLVECSRAISYEINDVAKWGYDMKRLEVSFAKNDPRRKLISKSSENYLELINQCATMEHLINALVWAIKNLPDYDVLRCHPTTSSGSTDGIPDNDIVLINCQHQYALFEVFDTTNPEKDSNEKEKKDVQKLIQQSLKSNQNPFINRLFIAISAETAQRIRKKGMVYYPDPKLGYSEYQHNHTYIFEITER